jgi:hypothetical protein
MEKLSRIALVIAYGIACLLVGWTLNGKYGVQVQVGEKIPSVRDIQRMVGAKEDGRIGKDTIEKWDAAICNQYAKPYFEVRK